MQRDFFTSARFQRLSFGLLLCVGAIGFCAAFPAVCWAQVVDPPVVSKSDAQTEDDKSEPLFDGKTLSGWTKTEFGGRRDVTVVDDAIQMDAGDPLTGITRDAEVPTDNFELTLEARKLKGNDFFCAATFPVNDSHCTLVLGGWGGTVVGLSCLDGLDASENETTKYIKFEHDQWYKIRIRVANNKIQCWLDDEKITDVDTTGKRISLRTEVLASRPLGFCSFQTQAQLRDVKLLRFAADVPTKEK